MKKEIGRLTTTRENGVKKQLTYASLFAGIGGFESGINKLGGVNVFASEIDKFARQSYEALYGVEPSGDITKIDSNDIPTHDLLTAGFPCQAFSVAGKRAGMAYVCKDCEQEQTISFQQYADRQFVCESCNGEIEAVDGRGLLFFEVARVARDKKPKFILLENVKGMVGHDKGRTLDTIVRTLSEIGYVVDFDVLNSKFFGVPQNRERIFIVAVREDIQQHEEWAEDSLKGNTVVPKGKRRIAEYDEVKTFNFDFPTNDTVTKRLRDILEDSVDENFYLDDEKTAALVLDLEERKQELTGDVQGINYLSRGLEIKSDDTAYCLKAGRTQELLEPHIKVVGNIPLSKNERTNRIYGIDGISPTPSGLGQGGGTEPKVLVDEVRAVLTPDRLEKRQNGRRFKEVDEEMFTLTSQDRHGVLLSNPHHFPTGDDINNTLRTGGKGSLTAKHNYEHIAEEVTEALPMDCERVRMIPNPRKDGDLSVLGDMHGGPWDKRYESIRRVYGSEGVAPTVTAGGGGGTEPKIKDKYRIRKLTPKECWRLQGFTDEQHDIVELAGVSNSQRYKQAGNAVTVNVIEAIIKNLIEQYKEEQ